jgi:hypothetical protein
VLKPVQMRRYHLVERLGNARYKSNFVINSDRWFDFKDTIEATMLMLEND